jgi:hypothetical protein
MPINFQPLKNPAKSRGVSISQIHSLRPETQRQATQHACLPRVAGRWGQSKVKKCTVRKIIFCTRLTRAAKAGQKNIVPARQTQRTNQGRTPIVCTLRVPIHLSFNSQQGPPLSISLFKTYLSGRTARHFQNHKGISFEDSYQKLGKTPNGV